MHQMGVNEGGVSAAQNCFKGRHCVGFIDILLDVVVEDCCYMAGGFKDVVVAVGGREFLRLD